ncbi:MAG: MFS transporter [Gammaproteobacteria bacterium]|nr:MFS transporter [Gammaproteobacteria bacterium]
MTAYWQLLRDHTRFAGFGLIIAFTSSFGQTYFIGIFGQPIQQDFGLSHTQWGGIYMAGTLLSALLLPVTGKWIDQIALPRYTLLVLLLLVLACLFITQVHSIWWLVAGVFLLRQSGQGLMSHVAYTSMGRYFDQQRGKATALVAVGFAMGEAVLPLLAVLSIAAIGWRSSYMVAGGLVLLLVTPLSMWLLRGHHKRHQEYKQQLLRQEDNKRNIAVVSKANPHSWQRREVLLDYRFYLLVPGLSAISMISTAMFFHHLNLADEKGWSHTFLTGNYLLYSLVAISVAIITGQLVDRFSARTLMPYTLLPLAMALSIINLIDDYWVIWPYFILLGVGNGFAQTTQAALWPECYGVRYLGAIKSVFWTLVVFASALGPVWLGLMMDKGFLLQEAVLSMVAYLLFATGLMVIGLRGFGHR